MRMLAETRVTPKAIVRALRQSSAFSVPTPRAAQRAILSFPGPMQAHDGQSGVFADEDDDSLGRAGTGLTRPADDVVGIDEQGPQRRFTIAVPYNLASQPTAQRPCSDLTHRRDDGQASQT